MIISVNQTFFRAPSFVAVFRSPSGDSFLQSGQFFVDSVGVSKSHLQLLLMSENTVRVAFIGSNSTIVQVDQ